MFKLMAVAPVLVWGFCYWLSSLRREVRDYLSQQRVMEAFDRRWTARQKVLTKVAAVDPRVARLIRAEEQRIADAVARAEFEAEHARKQAEDPSHQAASEASFDQRRKWASALERRTARRLKNVRF